MSLIEQPSLEIPLSPRQIEDHPMCFAMEEKEQPCPYISFSYNYKAFNQGNIGDNIQTIATERAISQIDKQAKFVRAQRDRLISYENKPPAICVMQGWFEHKISWLNFLPGASVVPVWVGTHLQPATRELLRPFLSICRGVAFRDEEIGCRDKATLEFCKAWGISAYLSRCLTLTLPRRNSEPTTPKIFVVTTPEYVSAFMSSLSQKNVTFIQQQNLPLGTEPEPYEVKAKELLALYSDEAGLVVTTALHCALPCVALGIPTVFVRPPNIFDPDRLTGMEDIIHVWTFEDLKEGRVEFPSKAPEIEDLKALMIENLDLSIRKAKGIPVDEDHLQEVRQKIENFSAT